MVGSELYELLPWDSEFFGVPIARMVGHHADTHRLTDAVNGCRARGIACLYFLASSDDPTTVRSAEDCGFRLVDVRVTLRHSLHSIPKGDSTASAASDHPIFLASSEDAAALADLVGDSFQHSRFYFDPGFPRDRCRALYRTWLLKSCHGGADAVFVAGPLDAPAGYATCTLRDSGQRAELGLMGVADEFRGRGLGVKLVRSLLTWCQERGVASVDVVTQGRNLAAQRLYQRCGFLTTDVKLWYHCWLDPGQDPYE